MTPKTEYILAITITMIITFSVYIICGFCLPLIAYLFIGLISGVIGIIITKLIKNL